VRRAGPGVIDQLNAALLGKLVGDKLLRGRKLRVDTTRSWRPGIDYPTDADLLEGFPQAGVGRVRRPLPPGQPGRPASNCARVASISAMYSLIGWSSAVYQAPIATPISAPARVRTARSSGWRPIRWARTAARS